MKYIYYKQELEQKYDKEKNRPQKVAIKVHCGKYFLLSHFANGRLVKGYHDNLTKDGRDTVIDVCETTLDD